jgi:uncharacterized protein YbjT (DUF2867 family)
MTDGTILVTGATGKQGGAAARHLLHHGWTVRALVRDPGAPAAQALAAAGAELATGDFEDPDSLAAAVKGAHGVFGVPPAAYGPNGWDTDLEYARGAALVDAAVQAGVAHFVFTSIATLPGKQLMGSDGKRRIENRIEASGMAWTHLRPVRFMENYLLRDSPIDGINNGLHRHLFRPDHRMQVIAVDDIGAFAALAFADPDRLAGQTLELAGDEPTPKAAAAAISAATGATVTYEQIPQEEAAGLGPQVAATWELMAEGHSWDADIAHLRRLLPGLRSFDMWLKENGADLIAALP